ncbi:hypothetical protein [Runella sp.]|uniref:hypothetical protein n=1 Tax=Runella sp. TaxID=1960881 RepID=UPI003D107D54
MSTLLNNWNFMRILRLGMGLWLIYSAVANHQAVLGLLGGLFALQSVTNTGCCGPNGCSLPNTPKHISKTTQEIHYEEVK